MYDAMTVANLKKKKNLTNRHWWSFPRAKMEKKFDPEDGLCISHDLKQPGTGVSSAAAKLQLSRYFFLKFA